MLWEKLGIFLKQTGGSQIFKKQESLIYKL